MAEEEDIERATEEFYLQQICCLRAFNSPKELPTDVSNLLCTSNIYGLIFAGLGQEIKVIDVTSVEALPQRENFNPTKPIPDFPSRSLRSKHQITHLALNADSTLLGVVCKGSGSVMLGIVHLPTFLNQGASNELQFSSSMELLRKEGAFMKVLHFHPSLPNLLSICLSNGKVSLLQVTKEKVSVGITWKGSIPINAMYWSPKGKSLILGQSDGKLLKCDKNLECKKEVPLPDIFDGVPQQVYQLHWISTFQVGITYKGLEGDSDPHFVIATSQRDGPTSFQSFGDVYFGFNEDRQLTYYSCDVPEWSVLCATSSNSFVVVVLGAVDGKWYKWTLKDSGNADLPLNEDYQETFPLGIAVNYNSTLGVKEGEHTLPPTPLLLTLSTDGMLSFYHMINKFPQAKLDILKAAQKLPMSAVLDNNKTLTRPQSPITSPLALPSSPQANQTVTTPTFNFPAALAKPEIPFTLDSMTTTIVPSKAAEKDPAPRVELVQQATPFCFGASSKPPADFIPSKPIETNQTALAMVQSSATSPNLIKPGTQFGESTVKKGLQSPLVASTALSFSPFPPVSGTTAAMTIGQIPPTPSFSFAKPPSGFAATPIATSSFAATPIATSSFAASAARFPGFTASNAGFAAPATAISGFATPNTTSFSLGVPATVSSSFGAPATTNSSFGAPVTTSCGFTERTNASSGFAVPATATATLSSSSAVSSSLFAVSVSPATRFSGTSLPVSTSLSSASLPSEAVAKHVLLDTKESAPGYANNQSSFPVSSATLATFQTPKSVTLPCPVSRGVVVDSKAVTSGIGLVTAQPFAKAVGGNPLPMPTTEVPISMLIPSARAVSSVPLINTGVVGLTQSVNAEDPRLMTTSSSKGVGAVPLARVGALSFLPLSKSGAVSSIPGVNSASASGLFGKVQMTYKKEEQTVETGGSVATTRRLSENRDDKVKQKLQNETALVDREIMKMITAEIDSMSQEIKAGKMSQKELQDAVEDIGSREEAKKLAKDTRDLNNLVKTLQQCCKDQDRAITSLKAKMLSSFDRLQDMQSVYGVSHDPKHINLLKLRPLDTVTELQRKEIHSKFSAVESLISDVTEALQIAWERREAERDRRKLSLKSNNIHNLYRSMESINKITNNLAARVEALSRKSQNVNLVSDRLMAEEYHPNGTISQTELDSILSVQPKRTSANTSLGGNVSASRSAELRSFLMKRTTTPVRRSKHFACEIRSLRPELHSQEMDNEKKSSAQEYSSFIQRKGQQNLPSAPPNTPSVPRSAGPSISVASLRQKLETEVKLNNKNDDVITKVDGQRRLDTTNARGVPRNGGEVVLSSASAITNKSTGTVTSGSKLRNNAGFNLATNPVEAEFSQSKPLEKETRGKERGKDNKDKPLSSETNTSSATPPPNVMTPAVPALTTKSFLHSDGKEGALGYQELSVSEQSRFQGTKLEPSSLPFLPPTHASTPLMAKVDQRTAPDTSVGNFSLSFGKDKPAFGLCQVSTTGGKLSDGAGEDVTAGVMNGAKAGEMENNGKGIQRSQGFTGVKASEQVFTILASQPPSFTASVACGSSSVEEITASGVGKTGFSTTPSLPAFSVQSQEKPTEESADKTAEEMTSSSSTPAPLFFTPTTQMSTASRSGALETDTSTAFLPSSGGTALSGRSPFAPSQAAVSLIASKSHDSSSTPTTAGDFSAALDHKPGAFSSFGTTSLSFGTAISNSTTSVSALGTTLPTFGASSSTLENTPASTLTTSSSTTNTASSAGVIPSVASTSSTSLFGGMTTASGNFSLFPSKPLFASTSCAVQEGNIMTVTTAASIPKSQGFGFGFSTTSSSTSSGLFNSSGSGFGFGTPSSQKQEGAGLFQGFGLGGKPNDPGRNPFGSIPTDSQQASRASAFGTGIVSSFTASQPSSAFGSSANAFGGGSGGVGSTGFGSSPTFGEAPAFGGAPSFGSSPSFGGAPSFGGSPTFGGTAFGGAPSFSSNATFGSTTAFGSGATFGSNNAQGPVFGQSASGSPSFGQLAAQDSRTSFGSSPSGFGSFASLAQQNTSFGSPSPSSNSFSSWR